MIGIKHLIEFSKTKYEPTDENYLIVQKYFEAYLKRLMLILLRKKNVQYKEATSIISDAPNHLSLTKQLDITILELTGTSYSELKRLDKKLKTLETCLLSYCRPLRNKIAHGADHNLKPELLDICIKITQAFVNKVEFHLNNLKELSAFDKPSKWGAKRITNKNGLTASLKKELYYSDIKKIKLEVIESKLNAAGISFTK